MVAQISGTRSAAAHARLCVLSLWLLGELVLMRWGLIPYFAKSLADFKGISTINARAESIEKSPTWRAPFERRRCDPRQYRSSGSGRRCGEEKCVSQD